MKREESGALSNNRKAAAKTASQAPVPSEDDDLKHVAGWYDATVKADYWFALSGVTPTEAAQLLSCENPHDPTSSGWLDVTSQAMAPDARRRLLRSLEDKGGKRPLIDWLECARNRGWPYDQWIDRYIAAKGASLPLPARGVLSDAKGRAPGITAEQRQEARHQACVDAGLDMPTDDYQRMPNGIKHVAEQLGISRPALSEDLKKRLARLSGRSSR